MSIFGVVPGYFYPRITYGSPAVNLDFDDPIMPPVIRPVPIGRQATAVSGAREALHERVEQQVVLVANAVTVTLLDAIWTYWSTWGALGKQATLILDRLSTNAGKWEYDRFNTYFTKAEALIEPLVLRRTTPARTYFAVQLAFRQGA